MREVEQWTQGNRLSLHPTKTRIVNAAEGGFDFLGYHFERGKHWPRKKSLRKLKETIRVQTMMFFLSRVGQPTVEAEIDDLVSRFPKLQKAQ